VLGIAQREFEILGPEEDRRQRFKDGEVAGVDVHLGYEGGVLTYELKIPLRKTGDRSFGISPDAFSMLGVGFETGEMSTDGRTRLPAPTRTVTSRSSRGRGRSTSSGSSPIPGGEANQPEPLKLWVTVQLPGTVPPTTN
jgi:hypothetical protein